MIWYGHIPVFYSLLVMFALMNDVVKILYKCCYCFTTLFSFFQINSQLDLRIISSRMCQDSSGNNKTFHHCSKDQTFGDIMKQKIS